MDLNLFLSSEHRHLLSYNLLGKRSFLEPIFSVIPDNVLNQFTITRSLNYAPLEPLLFQ